MTPSGDVGALAQEWARRGARLLPSGAIVTELGENTHAFRVRAMGAAAGPAVEAWRDALRGPTVRGRWE